MNTEASDMLSTLEEGYVGVILTDHAPNANIALERIRERVIRRGGLVTMRRFTGLSLAQSLATMHQMSLFCAMSHELTASTDIFALCEGLHRTDEMTRPFVWALMRLVTRSGARLITSMPNHYARDIDSYSSLIRSVSLDRCSSHEGPARTPWARRPRPSTFSGDFRLRTTHTSGH